MAIYREDIAEWMNSKHFIPNMQAHVCTLHASNHFILCWKEGEEEEKKEEKITKGGKGEKGDYKNSPNCLTHRTCHSLSFSLPFSHTLSLSLSLSLSHPLTHTHPLSLSLALPLAPQDCSTPRWLPRR